ncbi:methyltransferase family protein [Psychromonas sp. GE-S-Ul-11]|uniref:methyltransferase family protein n=1 Tax=unclassified Psychromonas TaxID=2614957 RepID=UPI00390C67B7
MELFYSHQQVVDFTRVYLAVFYSFVALFYTVRIIRKQQKLQSKSVIFPGKRFCNTWWNHMTFRVFRAAIWLVCLIRLAFIDVDIYLGTISFLNTASVIVLGNVLLTLGFLSTVFIHLLLGKHWRTGIDPSGPAYLQTTGVYSYSRHPMFVSIILSQLGFFLALPSLFSLACLVIGVIALQRQSIAEEKHLLNIFPVNYATYQAQVSKWL